MEISLLEALSRAAKAIRASDWRLAQHLLQVIETAMNERLTPEQRKPFEPIFFGLKSDFLTRQGEGRLAREQNAYAFASSEDGTFSRLLALMQEGYIELNSGSIEEAKRLYDEALPLTDQETMRPFRADIVANLGLIAYQQGDDEKAKELTIEAERIYSDLGQEKQAADCLHFLGTIARNEGDPHTAIAMTVRSLAQAAEAEDLEAIERRAGDLAFAIYSTDDGDYSEASNAINMALYASDQLWPNAQDAPYSVGARIERANKLFHNLEIKSLIEESGPEPLNAYVHICRAKGRILRDDIGEEAARLADSYRALSSRFADLSNDTVAVCALPHLLTDIDSHPIALIDHFALSAGDTFCVAHIVGHDGSCGIIRGRSKWPGECDQPLASRALHGEGQGIEGRRAAAEIIQSMERFVGIIPHLMGQSSTADDDARATMTGYADELKRPLSELGSWLFPPEVCQALKEAQAKHVFVAPDPRLFSLPWNALVLGDGTALVDQPWTMSVLPSALSLYQMALRRRTIAEARPLVVLAPDDEVNQHRGGNAEIEAISTTHPTCEIFTGATADNSRLSRELERGAWIHVRTHGTRSLHDSFVPKLYDGPWETPALTGAISVIIAMCCRVGEAKARGHDVFGLIDLAERSNAASLVAPVVSVDGIVGSQWSAEFYKALQQGSNLAESARQAAKSLRERYPHPSFWATMICFGDPQARLRIQTQVDPSA